MVLYPKSQQGGRFTEALKCALSLLENPSEFQAQASGAWFAETIAVTAYAILWCSIDKKKKKSVNTLHVYTLDAIVELFNTSRQAQLYVCAVYGDERYTILGHHYASIRREGILCIPSFISHCNSIALQMASQGYNGI